MHELYLSRELRDERAKELEAQGMRVSKSVASNQLLHPMYVKGYPRKLSPEECGFGNTIYKTHFAKLYRIEASW